VSVRDELTRDHERLDALLATMIGADGAIDRAKYDAFRRGLLRHIGIEERILFPLIGRDTSLVRQLHRDHAALSALLVPPPSIVEIEQIRGILAEHNPLEEGDGGLYARIADDVVDQVRAFPEVPLAPNADSEIVRRSIEQLLRQRR